MIYSLSRITFQSPSVPCVQTLTAAVAASCRLSIAQGSPSAALHALQLHLPQLESHQATQAGLESLWLLVLAAAVASTEPEAADVLAQARPVLGDTPDEYGSKHGHLVGQTEHCMPS